MRKFIVTTAAAVATVFVLLPVAANAAAMSAAPWPATASLVDKAQVFCGQYGCGHIHYGPRHHGWRWGRWGYNYRPACPTGYYYACRPGPLGYGQCACWPYRPY